MMKLEVVTMQAAYRGLCPQRKRGIQVMPFLLDLPYKERLSLYSRVVVRVSHCSFIASLLPWV